MESKKRLVEIIKLHSLSQVFLERHSADEIYRVFKDINDLADLILKEFVRREDVEICKDCGGCGQMIVEETPEEIISMDMAIDAGNRSLAGSVYRKAEQIIEQCQKCNGTGIVVKGE